MCLGGGTPQPAQPNYSQIIKDTTNAEVGLATDEFNAEKTYQPQYTNLALSNIGTTVNGTPGTAGLTQLLAQSNSATRGGAANDYEQIAPGINRTALLSNPLLPLINQSAASGLQAGGSLTPEQIQAMQQASRAAFASRGLTGSNASLADEITKQFNLSNSLLQQRQKFALQTASANQSAIAGSPLSSIFAQPNSVLPAAASIDASAGPTLFNPQAGNGLAQSNYQTASTIAQNNAAQQTAQTNGYVSAGASLAAAGIVAAALA